MRTHFNEKGAKGTISNFLTGLIESSKKDVKDIVILCIGTDRSTGDALGPLVGTMLSQKKGFKGHIFGTVGSPVHAKNLQEIIDTIHKSFDMDKTLIIAVDACLGKPESIGTIQVSEGQLMPGAGVNKQLPGVGDISIVGIVNISGFMEYLILQNTRLGLVWDMAKRISNSIYESVKHVTDSEKRDKQDCLKAVNIV